jgi:hypothetical protein
MEQLPRVRITGPHQTRPAEWPAEFSRFGDALEAVLGSGTHDLAGIVAGLNERDCRAPDGAVWTEASLRRRLADLGA